MTLKTTTAADLLRQTFEPVRFIVPDILPPGLTILAGRPKLGKSWLALNIAHAVATGGAVLGRQAEHGSALYLALEDGPRRLQGRLAMMAGDGSTPASLDFATECRTLDAGGAHDIREWVETTASPRLVVVDVLQRVRPKRSGADRLYADDYGAVLPLKEIADARGIAMLVVTHTRKAEAEHDPLDAVSATTGLTGAADHILILDRSSAGVTLYGRGRDAEEIDLALRFEPRTGTWQALGDRDEVHRSDTRTAILAALRSATAPLGPVEIARLAGIRQETIRQRLPGMVAVGEVMKVGRGAYASS